MDVTALTQTLNQSLTTASNGRITSASEAINSAKAQADAAKTEAAAKDFEAVFISQMLTPMFEGLETDGYFGGGNAENIYRSMLIEEYGKIIADRGGIGISSNVKAEMIAMQAKQQGGIP